MPLPSLSSFLSLLLSLFSPLLPFLYALCFPLPISERDLDLDSGFESDLDATFLRPVLALVLALNV